MPLAEVQTFDELVQREVGDKRFTSILLSSFAIAGLVLAVVGVYGVVSIVVSQRKQDWQCGLRLAPVQLTPSLLS